MSSNENIENESQNVQNVQNEQNIQNIEIDEQKKRRRKRADENGRNFSCSCGKSYLSYPALYTHIKTKHPQNEKIKNTKALEEGDNLHNNQQSEQRQENDQRDVSSNQPIRQIIFDFLKFKQFLQKVFSKNKTLTNLQLIRNSFNLTEKEHAYLVSIKELIQKKQQPDQGLSNPKEVSINEAFAKFLTQMGKYCNYTCNLALGYFVCALHQHLVKKYGQNYTQENSATSLPQNLNQFDKNNYINQPIVICKLIFYFCRWLYKQKFTEQLIRFNEVKPMSSSSEKVIQQN